jgi:hypothetical protein
LLSADCRLVRYAPVVYVAPPIVDTFAEFADSTLDLIIGIAWPLMLWDLRSPSSLTFAVTSVILPPEIFTVTATDPYRWEAVVPVYVPSFKEPEPAAVVLAAFVVAALVAVAPVVVWLVVAPP